MATLGTIVNSWFISSTSPEPRRRETKFLTLVVPQDHNAELTMGGCSGLGGQTGDEGEKHGPRFRIHAPLAGRSSLRAFSLVVDPDQSQFAGFSV